jgi:hypothetical protein
MGETGRCWWRAASGFGQPCEEEHRRVARREGGVRVQWGVGIGHSRNESLVESLDGSSYSYTPGRCGQGAAHPRTDGCEVGPIR